MEDINRLKVVLVEKKKTSKWLSEHLGYTQERRKAMTELTKEEREELHPIIFKNDFSHIEDLTDNKKICIFSNSIKIIVRIQSIQVQNYISLNKYLIIQKNKIIDMLHKN